MGIKIRNEQEIKRMRHSGEILAQVLKKLIAHSQIGVTTLELDRIAEQLIRQAGGIPCFKGYNGYPATICTSVNDGLVHGIPNNFQLKEGDIFSIDIGLQYQGWNTDMARTVLIGKEQNKEMTDKQHFLEVGEKALEQAVNQAKPGNRTGDISAAMQKEIEQADFSVSEIFTGHGIGRHIHEDPSIPCYGRKNTGILLKTGMTLAIEVIYAQGQSEAIISEEDGWTAKTRDGSWGGLFENTILVTQKEPLVLTKL